MVLGALRDSAIRVLASIAGASGLKASTSVNSCLSPLQRERDLLVCVLRLLHVPVPRLRALKGRKTSFKSDEK